MKEQDCRNHPDRQKMGQRILFTGPDGVGNYRLRRCDFPRSIGIGDMPREATGDLDYLFRPAPNTPPWQPKHCYTGGVGWGIEHGISLNARTLLSNTQIKRSEFRSAIEDRVHQSYQTPWREPPSETHGCGYDSENQLIQRKKISAHRQKSKR